MSTQGKASLAILTVVVWGASVLPARRAARLDPIQALNEE